MVKVGVSKCLRAGILVFVMAVVFGSCVGLGQTSGGSIVLGLDVDVATFDPRMRINTVELRMMELIFDGLIEISPEGNIAPDLATSWEQLDLTTWLFHLNQGVKFHDGSELTAEDVKFTYDTILAPGFGSTMASSYTAIAAIDVIDTYTVKFTLSAPFASFLGFNFQVQLSRGYMWRRIPRMGFESQVSFSADD